MRLNTLLLKPAIFALALFCTNTMALSITGDVWEAFAFYTSSGRDLLNNSNDYTVEFKTDGSASVKADCNSCNGSYTVNEDSISISIGLCTYMLCPDGSKGSIFIQALNGATTYKKNTANSLFVFYNNEADTLYLVNDIQIEPPPVFTPPQALTSSTWVLDYIGYANGSQVSPSGLEEYSLNFTTDLSVNGKINCNSCFGNYTISDTSIGISRMACTLMACSPSSVESNHNQARASADTYSVTSDKLLLFSGSDTLVYKHTGAVKAQEPLLNPDLGRTPGYKKSLGRVIEIHKQGSNKACNIQGRQLKLRK